MYSYRQYQVVGPCFVNAEILYVEYCYRCHRPDYTVTNGEAMGKDFWMDHVRGVEAIVPLDSWAGHYTVEYVSGLDGDYYPCILHDTFE